MLKKITKKIWFTFAALLIVMAVISSLVRALTPWASHYKPQLEKQLSQVLGSRVTIRSLETGWYWFEPVIKLHKVSIDDDKNTRLDIHKITFGIDLLESILNWQLQPGVMTVDGSMLSIEQTIRGWRVNNLNINQHPLEIDISTTNNEVAKWFLKQSKFNLKNIDVQLHLKDGTVIPLSDFTLKLHNVGNTHFLNGYAVVEQTTESNIAFVGKFKASSSKVRQASGELYVDIKNLVMPQWLSFYPLQRFNIKSESGLLNTKLWLTLDKGNVSSFQSTFAIKNLGLINTQSHSSKLLQKVQANLAWKRLDDGWQLSGDSLRLRLSGKKFRSNAFVIKKQKNTSDYFIKHVDLSVMQKIIDFLKPKEKVSELLKTIKPKGMLNDFQISLQEQQLKGLLFGFSNISVSNYKNYPAISGLSGAIRAQNTQGHLELASNSVTIKLKKGMTKPINLSQLNGIFDWKKLSHGWRVIGKRLLLDEKNITLSSRFTLDDIFSEDRTMHLEGEFSGHDLQALKAYIPYDNLKKKLAIWLKEAIIRVDKAAGSFDVRGSLKDFPFDKKNGVFKIDSHLFGSELKFSPQWPVATDIDGTLSVNQRSLEAEITSARLNDIPIKQLNLNIQNLGLDKEVLYLHGKANTTTAKAKQTILDTPLAKHLVLLNAMDFRGGVGLDLNLEIPLYPENDDNLAFGKLEFDNNTVLLKRWGNLSLSDLSGELSFSQEGVLDSQFKAKLFNFPLSIAINTYKNPQVNTQLKLSGSLDIDSIHTLVKLPFLSLFKGQLNYSAKVNVTEPEDDFDSLIFQTDLKGVQINLPRPFSKSLGSRRQLTINSQFALNREIRVKVNYADLIGALLRYIPKNDHFNLDNGEIRLGSAYAVLPKSQSIRVIGNLKRFVFKEWWEALSKIEGKGITSNENSILDKLNYVDIHVKKAKILGQSYDNCEFSMHRHNKDWQVKLKSQQINGKATISWPNKVQVDLNKWYVHEVTPQQGDINFDFSKFPKFKLTVGDFRVGNYNLGQLSLNTEVVKNQLLLNDFLIKAPSYELHFNGLWTKQASKAVSSIKGYFYTSDLAKTLQQWNKIPIIEARKGELRFDVNWPGSFFNLSLGKLDGQAHLTLRNGQITHLDKETEEKIGLGKLLSILSLQTLPRRLVLDFSDLSNKGFSYDIFKGSYTIKKGNVSTQDSYMDGPVAYVSMKGSLSLPKQQYDVVLKVSPHITASLPIVATIAGGPVAGIATWVASKIINQGMRQVSAYTYKITGPWDSPVVQQLSITQKK